MSIESHGSVKEQVSAGYQGLLGKDGRGMSWYFDVPVYACKYITKLNLWIECLLSLHC